MDVDREERVPEDVAPRDDPLGEPLGPGRPDEVPRRFLEEARPRHAHHGGERRRGEREHGQRQVAQEPDRVLAGRDVAGGGEPAEPEREHQDEQHADHEHRHREAGERDRRGRRDRRVAPGGGRRRSRGGRRSSTARAVAGTTSWSVRGSRLARSRATDRSSSSEVPRSPRLTRPSQEHVLGHERAVEPEARPDARELLRARLGGITAQDEERRVAGEEMDREEEDGGDDPEEHERQPEPAQRGRSTRSRVSLRGLDHTLPERALGRDPPVAEGEHVAAVHLEAGAAVGRAARDPLDHDQRRDGRSAGSRPSARRGSA